MSRVGATGRARARFLAPTAPLAGQAEGAEPLRVPPETSAVRIDGVLDEEAWRRALRVELGYEFRPAENVTAPVRVECLVTHDPPVGPFGGLDRRFADVHESRSWNAWLESEALSSGFRADLGFVPRVDFAAAEGGVEGVRWGKAGAFLSQAEAGVGYGRGENDDGVFADQTVEARVRFDGPYRLRFRAEFRRARQRYRTSQILFSYTIDPRRSSSWCTRGVARSGSARGSHRPTARSS